MSARRSPLGVVGARPSTGPVCECGERKSRQARTCQRCHSELRGYGRGTRARSILAETQSPLLKREALEAAQSQLLARDDELSELVRWQIKDDTHLAQIGRGFFYYEDGKDHSDDLIF